MPTKPVMPKGEPRCLGRDCKERSECKRYERTVYENLTQNARKGHLMMMSLQDSDGVCRRKM